jgi:hypothetical protein
MQELSPAPLPDEAARITQPDGTSTFLRAHAVHLDMIANYEELLAATVFSRRVSDCDAKRLRAHRRALGTMDAYKILVFIWKESSLVTEDDLIQAGLCREYQGRSLTAYSLATEMTVNPKEVAKLNSRIRKIVIAAAHYELIDRNAASSTEVILSGTELLHDFMSDLSAKNILAMSRFVPLVRPSAIEAAADGGGSR